MQGLALIFYLAREGGSFYQALHPANDIYSRNRAQIGYLVDSKKGKICVYFILGMFFEIYMAVTQCFV